MSLVISGKTREREGRKRFQLIDGLDGLDG